MVGGKDDDALGPRSWEECPGGEVAFFSHCQICRSRKRLGQSGWSAEWTLENNVTLGSRFREK